MNNFIRKYRIIALFILLGGIGGFLYWKYVGCVSGTCPITSNWYSSSGYGMLIAGLLGDMFRKKEKTVKEQE